MTSGNPSLKLSVLIPVRNEGLNIKIMLKILHAVIEVSHEVIIVYDQPDDDSIEIVNKLKDQYSNTRLVYNQSGVGIINALKFLLLVSSCEFCWFLLLENTKFRGFS